MSECGLMNVWNLLEVGNDTWKGSARQWHNTENEHQVWLRHPSQGLTWEEREWVTLKLESSNILNYIRKFEILQIKGKCVISKQMTTRNIFIFDSIARKDKKKKEYKELKATKY